MKQHVTVRQLSQATQTIRSEGLRSTSLPFLYQTCTLRRWYSDEQTRNGRYQPVPFGDSQSRWRQNLDEGSRSRSRRFDSRSHRDSFKAPRPEARVARGDGLSRVDRLYGGETVSRTGYKLSDSNSNHTRRPPPTPIVKDDIDFVPFEGQQGQLDSIPLGPSLTETEKETFRRLRDLGLQAKQRAPNRGRQQSTATTRAGTSKDWSSDLSDPSLDEILDSAFTEAEEEASDSSPPDKEIHQTAATDYAEYKRHEAVLEQRQTHLRKTKAALDRCSTDFDIWNVLNRDILAPVASLKLDTITSPTDDPIIDRSGSTSEDPSSEGYGLSVLGSNLAILMGYSAQVMSKKCPTSPFMLSIIPALRRIGPSAYALGACTPLYNEVLAYVLERNGDVPGVLNVLEEMEREVIEPDGRTMYMLTKLVESAGLGRQGRHGPAVKSLWESDRMKTAGLGISEWMSRKRLAHRTSRPQGVAEAGEGAHHSVIL